MSHAYEQPPRSLLFDLTLVDEHSAQAVDNALAEEYRRCASLPIYYERYRQTYGEWPGPEEEPDHIILNSLEERVFRLVQQSGDGHLSKRDRRLLAEYLGVPHDQPFDQAFLVSEYHRRAQYMDALEEAASFGIPLAELSKGNPAQLVQQEEPQPARQPRHYGIDYAAKMIEAEERMIERLVNEDDLFLKALGPMLRSLNLDHTTNRNVAVTQAIQAYAREITNKLQQRLPISSDEHYIMSRLCGLVNPAIGQLKYASKRRQTYQDDLWYSLANVPTTEEADQQARAAQLVAAAAMQIRMINTKNKKQPTTNQPLTDTDVQRAIQEWERMLGFSPNEDA